ncbi:M12 family metallo-peptidase [Paenibacillus camerounensis]|uniref:M12 family metallo-peptidase n=1 Tax=Paenibacillus camerounensis TaxID=1243663 RepID=UPI0006942329|nr:M12 family metallo-peptidase [Paenibacillus camerounensis]
MNTKKKYSVLAAAFLMCSMALSTSGFASEVSKDIPITSSIADEVKVFYQNDVKLSGGSPLDTSVQAKSLIQTTPKVERSSVATVYDEVGNVIDNVTIKQNVTSNENSKLAASGKLCTVLVAVDEEYRAKHSDWQTLTTNAVEAADDAFNAQFGIDLTVTAYRYWFSSGNNASELLANLTGSATDNYDFVVGFTAEPDFTHEGKVVGGLAYEYPSAPTYAAYSTVLDQTSPSSNWHALQHELSHNYGLSHDPEASTPICIMNYGTMYNTSAWHSDHWTQLNARKIWYGSNTN